MPGGLTITTDWKRLEEGTPAECACFAAIGICWNNIWLTEGRDAFVNVIRRAPYLSGYHLAEWIAWNWWRLRWEPHSKDPEWVFAHRLSNIGGGYVWPNITVFSDGERTALIAKPASERPSTPYRYINDAAATLASRDFEATIDQFVETVRGRLRAEGVADTNLDTLWSDLAAERRDPDLAQRRKFEALLEREPDEADEIVLQKLKEDSKELGESAMSEVAAHHDREDEVLTAKTLQENAERNGFDTSPRDSFHLQAGTGLPRTGDVAAWRVGAEAARAVREQAKLGADPISDAKLSDIAGVVNGALDERATYSRIAYALDRNANAGRIVFRSKWKTGRRFELARIVGDRLASRERSRLFPVTRAHTYRQKMQRSFAAELLSPFDTVDDALDGDYSDETQQELAEHFEVSPLTIRTLLVNHGRVDRDELEGDFDIAAA